MPAMTLRDIPEDLQHWLRDQATAHHRSVNKEVIVMLEELRRGRTVYRPRPSVEELLALGRQCEALPERDGRSAEEILGYDDNGLPG